MIIIERDLILVITKEIINADIRKYKNIDVQRMQLDSKAIKKINDEAREKYSYIFFTNECTYGNELINFLPVFSIKNCRNKLFINELLVNPIIIEEIEKIIDSDNEIQLAVLLKHILKNNINKEDFDFIKEMECMQKLYKCTNQDMENFKERVYKAIEKHYSQNVITRKIKYQVNKDEIVKMALYKLIENIDNKLKNTNELVFKKFISIII